MSQVNSAKAFSFKALSESIDHSQDLPYALAHENAGYLLIAYRPHQPDRQTPHKQDEVYFAGQGNAALQVGEEALPLKTGDSAFAPAGAEHGFKEASDDFLCWAVFFRL